MRSAVHVTTIRVTCDPQKMKEEAGLHMNMMKVKPNVPGNISDRHTWSEFPQILSRPEKLS